MEPERFRALERLYFDALEVPGEDRDAWIIDRCAGDSALAAELRELLAAGAAPDDPARAVVQDALAEAPDGMVGREVGAWRLIRELGHGGMGTVYEAARADGAFDQHVALKLLRLGLRDAVSIERFRRERQVLARLSHPGIATLLDGGTAADGTPWVAMELVRGQPLLAHADAAGLELTGRAALMVALCDAMAYAHRNLVVHRDLKPDNVLVDDEGRPRVLDFGIAKLLDDEAAGTATAQRAFTAAYAAPEQVLGEPVSTATDVYALGVMLYELCTGERPHALTENNRTDWARLLTQVPPPSPRSRVRGMPRDLEAIILMALRREPERRYASAEELGVDLRRFLTARPVQARPDAFGYRFAKAVQRYPGRFAVAGLLLAFGVAFLVSTIHQSRRIAAERDAAVRAAAISDATTEFLVELFQAPDPKELGGRTLSAEDLLDRGRDRIAELDIEPLARARLLHVMGLAYANLGRYGPGIPLLEGALEIRRAETGSDSAPTADSSNRLGNILRAAGRYREAEPLLVAALEYRLASGEAASIDLADSFNNVGLLQRDLAEYDRAATNLERAIAMHLEVTGPTLAVAIAQHNLALVRLGQARPQEAADLLEAALRLKAEVGMGDRATYANSWAALARARLGAGELEAALEAAEGALALRRRILPETHPQVASGLATLADVLVARGDEQRALAAHDEATAIAAAAYGEEAWRTLRYRADRARVLELLGRGAAAEPAYRAALAHARDAFEPDSLLLANAWLDLGRWLLTTGDAMQARALLETARNVRQARLTPDHPGVQEAEALLALASGEQPTLPPMLAADPRTPYRLLRRLLP